MRTLITTYEASGNTIKVFSKAWSRFTGKTASELMHMVRLIYDESSTDRLLQILWATGSHDMVTTASVINPSEGNYALEITCVASVLDADGNTHSVNLNGHELTIAVDFGTSIDEVLDELKKLIDDAEGFAKQGDDEDVNLTDTDKKLGYALNELEELITGDGVYVSDTVISDLAEIKEKVKAIGTFSDINDTVASKLERLQLSLSSLVEAKDIVPVTSVEMEDIINRVIES